MMQWVPANHLLASAGDLSEVETDHVYYFDHQKTLRPWPGRIGLFDAAGAPLDIVSDTYTILPHRAVAESIERVLTDLDLAAGALAAIEGTGPVMKVTVLFPQHEVPGHRYTLGFQVANSYDLSKALRADLVLYGPAAIRRMLALVGPELQMFHKGLTTEAFEQRLRTYIPQLLGPETLKEVAALIEDASNDVADLPTVEQKQAALRPAMFGQGHLDAVVATVPDRASRWELFSAVAAYTDSPAVSSIVRDKINSLAERKLLLQRLAVPGEKEAAAPEGEVGGTASVSPANHTFPAAHCPSIDACHGIYQELENPEAPERDQRHLRSIKYP